MDADFLGVVEASDLIIPLTDRVLEIACAQLAHWLADGLPLPVAVNVSVAALTGSPTCSSTTHCRPSSSPWRSPRPRWPRTSAAPARP